MTIKAKWPTVGVPVPEESDEPRFFSDHEWETIEAATARIMPTDHDPGAREAGVTRFIDRYLSGIGYIYAAGDGSGFLELSGKLADAWRSRIGMMQSTYRDGIRRLDELADEYHGGSFASRTEEEQDHVLELLSGKPKPEPLRLGPDSGVHSFLQGVFDEGLGFFEALALHTRQGFYCDPVYGGNRDRVGWEVIGFPGPRSLADTQDGTYSLRDRFVQEYDWETLVPYLKEGKR